MCSLLWPILIFSRGHKLKYFFRKKLHSVVLYKSAAWMSPRSLASSVVAHSQILSFYLHNLRHILPSCTVVYSAPCSTCPPYPHPPSSVLHNLLPPPYSILHILKPSLYFLPCSPPSLACPPLTLPWPTYLTMLILALTYLDCTGEESSEVLNCLSVGLHS